MPIANLSPNEITTPEGLGTLDKLHPLQKVFIDEQAVQCGYCTSGMIITAADLLNRNP
jgi:nicotinate dehydrogenase subunit A